MKTKKRIRKSQAIGIGFANGATRSERRELGKLARERSELEAHADLHIRRTHKDLIDILETSNIGRIEELVPIRYGRMLTSPFTFYRGSAALMALDLSGTENSGLTVQVCGDCHIQNFGAFATPERKIVVDINDFDETLPAPWEWDVKRLAASLVLAALDNGLSLDVGREAAYLFAKSYREHFLELSEMTHLDVWHSQVEVQEILDISTRETRKRREKAIQEAMKKSSAEYLMEKFVTKSAGKLRFKELPPLLMHMEGVTAGEQEQEAFAAYRESLRDHRRILLEKYHMVDIARKVVGIGSVGTMCGVLLLADSEEDILLLQLKEARRSVLEPYVGRSIYEHQGERVVAGQKLMQAATDQFLGWTTGPRSPHRHFFIRQLRDVKVGTNTMFWGKADFKTVPKLVGHILSRAHARSGDASFMRGYLGKNDTFDQAISKYAAAYAKQTEHDYEHFRTACKSGRLKSKVIIE